MLSLKCSFLGKAIEEIAGALLSHLKELTVQRTQSFGDPYF